MENQNPSRPFDLCQRTKRFSLDVMAIVEKLPRNLATDVVGRQLLRSATSVGANTRAAKRAKSNADFISKMGTVEEEADESCFWLELLLERGFVDAEKANELLREDNELTAITVASIRTAKQTLNAEKSTRKPK